MTFEFKKFVLYSLLLFILSYFLCVLPVHGEIAIIANKNVTDDALTAEEINNIFLGKKKRWNDNSPIVVAVLISGTAHKEFLKNIVHRTPSQFKNVWKKLVFTGQAQYPRTFKTEKDMINFVFRQPGAIGYVLVEEVNDNVKIITPE